MPTLIKRSGGKRNTSVCHFLIGIRNSHVYGSALLRSVHGCGRPQPPSEMLIYTCDTSGLTQHITPLLKVRAVLSRCWQTHTHCCSMAASLTSCLQSWFSARRSRPGPMAVQYSSTQVCPEFKSVSDGHTLTRALLCLPLCLEAKGSESRVSVFKIYIGTLLCSSPHRFAS